MNRAHFIKQCAAGCVAGTLAATWLQSCTAQKALPVTYKNNQLLLPQSAMYTLHNDLKKWKRSLVIRHEQSPFPIVLFRYSNGDYRAFLLRCPHQGAELSVYGDLISCSAHGSEFNTQGEVQQGPADAPLHSFRVTQDQENIYIHLA